MQPKGCASMSACGHRGNKPLPDPVAPSRWQVCRTMAPRSLPDLTGPARATAAGAGEPGPASAAADPRGVRDVRLARRRRGPRAGDVRARAAPPALHPARPRHGVPAARAAPHVRRPRHAARRSAAPRPRRRRSSSGSSTRAPRPRWRWTRSIAYAAMADLSEPLRATIVAVDVVGLSYKEAARSLRTRVGTIMSRLYRAREQVAAAMEAVMSRLRKREQALLVRARRRSPHGRRPRRSRGAAARDPGRRPPDSSASAASRARSPPERSAGRWNPPRRLPGNARRSSPSPARSSPCCSFSLLLPLQGSDTTVERAAATSQLPATQPAPEAAGDRPARRGRRRPVPRLGTRVRLARDGHAPRRDRRPPARPPSSTSTWATGSRTRSCPARRSRHRPNARVVRRDGLEMAVYRDPRHGGHDVAVFERGGRTCVVAGHVLEVSTLLKLAAWRGGGSVRS